jgi:hypothetical protein
MKLQFTSILLLAVASLCGQQVADTAWQYSIARPRQAPGRGSAVCIDAAHYNFHTADGRYAPFARLLERDGYRISSGTAKIEPATLAPCRIFVISNAIDSAESWSLPNPSAFSAAEIKTLNDWVKNGGRILLIADHMPFAGAAADLARSFGFEYVNCFAMDNRRRALERFYKGNGTLLESELTSGIDTVVSFTGSAFRIPADAKGVLALRDYSLLSPENAWQFEEATSVAPGDGYFQGAYRVYGKGKIVVWGEAAMFSAQLAGANRNPVGMNHPGARQNAQLLLNIMHWLDE